MKSKQQTENVSAGEDQFSFLITGVAKTWIKCPK
jgi:hypothetical protein